MTRILKDALFMLAVLSVCGAFVAFCLLVFACDNPNLPPTHGDCRIVYDDGGLDLCDVWYDDAGYPHVIARADGGVK